MRDKVQFNDIFGDFMTYQVKTNVFEGPLDLLLHLIKRMEIDIYDIPMAEVTEQYLVYIHTLSDLELNEASEYLVMSATLLSIKSKMLLPNKAEEEEEDVSIEEEDPRTELVEQLIEYKRYKEAAELFKQKEHDRSHIYTKPPSDLSQFAADADPISEADSVSVFDMLAAYNKLLKRKRLRKPAAAKVEIQKITIEQRMEELLEIVEKHRTPIHFSDFFHHDDKSVIIVTFLAILELMKSNAVYVEQTGNFEEIYIKAKEEIVRESS